MRAVCTWGDGPDILLVFEQKDGVVLYSQTEGDAGSACLSMEDAKQLVIQLQKAITTVEALETQLVKDMEGKKDE